MEEIKPDTSKGEQDQQKMSPEPEHRLEALALGRARCAKCERRNVRMAACEYEGILVMFCCLRQRLEVERLLANLDRAAEHAADVVLVL